MPVSEVQNYYKYYLQDITELLEKAGPESSAIRDAAIKEVIFRYSERIPKGKVVLVTFVPGAVQLYALPNTWEAGFSRIISVESPIDKAPPSYLREKSYGIVNNESSDKLYFSYGLAENFRLRFTTRHSYTAGPMETSTWMPAHASLLGKWAAAIACQMFADRYAHSVESGNDGVNWRTKSQELRDNSKMLMQQVELDIKQAEIKAWHELSSGRITGMRRT
jgi:hypothetical protein